MLNFNQFTLREDVDSAYPFRITAPGGSTIVFFDKITRTPYNLEKNMKSFSTDRAKEIMSQVVSRPSQEGYRFIIICRGGVLEWCITWYAEILHPLMVDAIDNSIPTRKEGPKYGIKILYRNIPIKSDPTLDTWALPGTYEPGEGLYSTLDPTTFRAIAAVSDVQSMLALDNATMKRFMGK